MDCFICRSKSPHTSTYAVSFTISSSHSRLTRYHYLLLWNKGYKCIVGQFDRLGVLRFFKNYINITLLNNFKTVKSLNNQKSLFNLKFEFCIICKPIYIFLFHCIQVFIYDFYNIEKWMLLQVRKGLSTLCRGVR